MLCFATNNWAFFIPPCSALLVRFEVNVSLLLVPARAHKRGLGDPFPLVGYAGIQPAIRKRVPASTACYNHICSVHAITVYGLYGHQMTVPGVSAIMKVDC